MRVDRLYASNGGVTQTYNIMQSIAGPLHLAGPLFIGVSSQIYCEFTAGMLHLTGPLFIGVSLRIYCGPVAPCGHTVNSVLFCGSIVDLLQVIACGSTADLLRAHCTLWAVA